MTRTRREPGDGFPEAEDGGTGYRALLRAAAVVEAERVVVEVRGERALRMVNGLVSNDVSPLKAGRAVYAFVLTPKGRIVAEVRLVPAWGGVWLDTPVAAAAGLLEHLGRYLPPLYARFRVLESRRRVAIVGPRAREALERAWPRLGWGAESSVPDRLAPLEALEVEAPDARGAGTRAGPGAGEEGAPGEGVVVVRREEVEGPGFDLYPPARRLRATREALLEAARGVGGGFAGPRAYEVWQVERGIPAYGPDISTANLPQETGQEKRAVSFEKGCYTGQEVVARIHYRGHVNRLLRGLAFGAASGPEAGSTGEAAPSTVGPVPPPPGSSLFREGRAIGTVTTAVLSPRFGPIGLGYVRREAEPGDLLATEPEGSAWVRVRALPFTMK